MQIKTKSASLFACLILTIAVCGCGDADDSGSSISELEAMADQLDVQAEVEETQSDLDALAKAAKAARAEADRLAGEAPSPVTTEDMKRGKKITRSGPLSTPLRAGIVAEQKMNMIQWRQALDIYAATNNLDYPESHEEFMTNVIEANAIELEPLKEMYEYWYNVEENNLNKRIKPEVIEAAEQAAVTAEAAYAAAQE